MNYQGNISTLTWVTDFLNCLCAAGVSEIHERSRKQKQQSREAKTEQKGREAEHTRKMQKMAVLIKFFCFPFLFYVISSEPLVTQLYRLHSNHFKN